MNKLTLKNQPNEVLNRILLSNPEAYNTVSQQLVFLNEKVRRICSKDLEIDDLILQGNCVKAVSFSADPDEVTTLEASLLAYQARHGINKYVVSLAVMD